MHGNILNILGDSRLRVLDVGARGGFIPRFFPVAKKTEMYGFEPDPTEFDRLQTEIGSLPWDKVILFPYALGRAETGRDFYVTKNPELSSLLPPNRTIMRSDGWEVVKISTVDTVGLDDLFACGALEGDYDFIKIDTQGSELEILASGEKKFLPQLLGVEIEAEFVEAYLNQPKYRDIEQYLDSQGFEIFSMEQNYYGGGGLHTTKRRLFYSNAVFLRTGQWVETLETEKRPEILRKLVVVYLLYGFFADAMKLADKYDDILQKEIEHYYASMRILSLRWRASLIRDFLLCLLHPTSRNRVRLARRSLKVISSDGLSWSLSEPNV